MMGSNEGFDVRMIAVDLDGTLLSHEGQVGERNRRAIGLARTAGVEIVVATGRRHSYAMRVLRAAGLAPENVVISSNGTVVRTAEATLIERTHMKPEAVEMLCATLGEFRDALVVTFDKVGPDGEDTHGALVVEELASLHESIGRWMVANEPYIARVKPIEDAFRAGLPIQMMVCGTVERMRRAEARMLEHAGVAAVGESLAHGLISLNRTEYPDRDLSIVDILPAGCSKGSALLRLAQTRGIRPAEIMAIGDNWNDLSMFEVAGHPVVMGDGPAEILALARQRGWTIGAPHDEDGAAQAIESAIAEPALSTAAAALPARARAESNRL